MASTYTLSRIADYFLKLAEEDIDQKITKSFLNEKRDFAPASLFDLISKNKDAITSTDLQEFFSSMGESLEYSVCFKLLLSLANSNPGKLKLRDFMEFICDSEYWTRIHYRKFYGEPITYGTKYVVCKLFKKENSILNLIESEKLIINKLENISVHSLFYAINTNGRKFISDVHVSSFLKAYGKRSYFSNDCINAVMRRLDRDRDGVVSFLDFFDLIKYIGIPHKDYISDAPKRIKPLEDKEQKPIENDALEKPIEITPPKEKNPNALSEEVLKETKKTLVYEIEKKKADFFSEGTRNKINKFSSDYRRFQDNPKSDTKSVALESMNDAKEALHKSLDRIYHEIADPKETSNEVEKNPSKLLTSSIANSFGRN